PVMRGFFFSSRRRHTRWPRDWSSDVCSSDLTASYQGFQTITQTNIEVNVGTDVVINFNLKPGAVTQTVEVVAAVPVLQTQNASRSEEHTSELQSRGHLVCRLLLEKKKKKTRP